MSLLRLTLRQLGIFSAVARSGTTTAAGDEIGLSQSAVSSAI
ncbi:MAG: LysR family transcriptional regulator, partial [Proteobacteria bacterium]|nr:LysR family transcriptional regulator [Pseudomonadota bacterium]